MTETTNETTADLATEEAQTSLNQLILLGVVGPEEAPRALLRSAGGNVQSVSVGDRIWQGTVVGIGDGQVVLQGTFGTRHVTMPTAA